MVKTDVTHAKHERVQLGQDPQASGSTTSSEHGHTILQEIQAAKIFDEVGQRSFKRLFPGVAEDRLEQAALSASQSGMGYKGTRDVAIPAHFGAIIAATPRILNMIQDGATVGLIPKQPLVARLDAILEAATAVYLEALDDSEKLTTRLHLQKAAHAAVESWQQPVHGHSGPTVTNPTERLCLTG